MAICSQITTNNGKEIFQLNKVITKKPQILELKKSIILIPKKEIEQPIPEEEIEVYRLGDDYTKERIKMSNLGIDVGTKTIVVSYKDNKNKTCYISEINGYWLFERATPFVENMLNDPNKTRSDGTKRAARYFKEDDAIVILGKDAEEFAYSKNDTLLRPMAEGGISPDDLAMTVLTAIIHGLIGMAENQIGKFTDPIKVCYCTTADAINKTNNVAYHERAVDLILDNYNSKHKIDFRQHTYCRRYEFECVRHWRYTFYCR